MTDSDLVEKKLAFIRTCLADLQRLAKPENLEADPKERRFVEHTLQLAVQAAIDVASHIVSDERLGEVRTYGELFDRLFQGGWISDARLVRSMKLATAFRNVLVHGYADVDLEVLKDVLSNGSKDLETFVSTIAARL